MLDFDATRRWNDWANRVVYAVLQESAGRPQEALAAFQHVLETEITWLRRIHRYPSPNVPLWGVPSFSTCTVYLDESRELVAALTTERLDEPFSYQNSRGQTFKDVTRTALGHMFLHSSQYRGEAAGFLNAAGHPVPDLDLIFWLRRQPPPG
jgi:uncharacterized damage-inducible protein DinB